MVVATHEDGCELCRGIIVKQDEFSRDYEVFYMDWGTSHVTSMVSVDRPTEFWDISAQAVPCVIPEWNRLSSAATETLQNLKKSEISLEATFTTGPGRVMLRDFVKSLDSDYIQKFCYSINIKELSELLWD